MSFICKNDREALLELAEIPLFPFGDKIKEIIEKEYSFCHSYSYYVYVMDKRVIGLGFHHTDLKRIPEPIFKLDSLRELCIENNKLIEIPDSISRLKNLKKLLASSNKIKSVSKSINQLNLLEVLDFKRNRIKDLPEDLQNLKNLESLNLSKNDLYRLPESIIGLEGLRYFDISNNPHLIISEHVSEFLYRKKCKIIGSFLVENFGITERDRFKRADLDKEITEEKVLGILNSEWKSESTIIDEEKRVLEELEHITGAKFSLVKPSTGVLKSYGSRMEVCIEEGVVTELGIYEVKLNEFPSIIQDLHHLRDLTLVGNQLEKLPSNLNNLNQLKRLCLSDNQFTALPENIGSLNSLEHLIINNIPPIEEYSGILLPIRIERLPSSIGDLKSLKSLNLLGNHLGSLPSSIEGLINLNELNVMSNYIEELPESIGKLKHLKKLYININLLVSLPESMKSLDSFEQISLTDNPRKLGNLTVRSGQLKIPKWLYELKSLREINGKELKI